MSNDPKPAIQQVFLAGEACHEGCVATNTNIESPQRWYGRHVAEDHDMAPPMQRHGGILLTKSLLTALGVEDPSTPGIDETKLLWTAPPRKRNTSSPVEPLTPRRENPSDPPRRYYQAIYGLQEREQLPGSREKTFRMMTLLSKEFVNNPTPPTIIEQLKELQGEPILAVEDLKLSSGPKNEGLWHANTGFWEQAAKESVKTILVKTNQPRQSIDSYLAWRRRTSSKRSVVFVANVTSLLVKAGGVHRSWDALVEESFKALFPDEPARHSGKKKAVVSKPSRWFDEMTLVLLYGSEGCLVIAKGERTKTVEFTLHWDRDYSYGAMERRLGWVPGPGNVVLATLISKFSNSSDVDVKKASQEAWFRARTCMILGHQRDESDSSRKKADEKTLKSLGDLLEASLKIDTEEEAASTKRDIRRRVRSVLTRSWTPLNLGRSAWEPDCSGFVEMSVRHHSGEDLVKLGCHVIAKGSKGLETKSDILPFTFPLLKVGDLIAFEGKDVTQISYLDQLIGDYVDRRFARRPLSIGVFGKPGAGKSFAVKQILKALAISSTTLEFNLSPMNPATGADLIACFRKVQSCALHDRELPLVFWDEFDSHELAWLKHFLAPMQDGEFHLDGDHHSIGRAVFVFAGGTYETVEGFRKMARRKNREAVKKKVPDFMSRLKAFYDVPDVELGKDEYRFPGAHNEPRFHYRRWLPERTGTSTGFPRALRRPSQVRGHPADR